MAIQETITLLDVRVADGIEGITPGQFKVVKGISDTGNHSYAIFVDEKTYLGMLPANVLTDQQAVLVGPDKLKELLILLEEPEAEPKKEQ